MRKDKGLNGDLDRLPMLTWIMFLKFLDDEERLREDESILAGQSFRPAIEPPYRWRDWAARPEGITGSELIAFVNNDETIRPDGTRGVGLFAYLRGLQAVADAPDRRDVIATVFRGVVNRMVNGYLLRDVINKVNEIQFSSSEEIHTLSSLYESMLKEMRDAAWDSGEFYTPRPLVRFMVAAANPRLGETVLDPASGTGGFLVEAYRHLEAQCRTVEDRRILQDCTIFGGEAKPLPYLLGQMNLLLHGLEAPRIDPENSLRFRLSELRDADRADVILTNPPFGGEEEPGIQQNFAPDRRTSETALLYLQLIMRKLRRHPLPGRAGVVVPNGTLFGDGVAARIKEELLTEFNLHTIVRLPNGVFAPYTPIPRNVVFFDRSKPTGTVWYYELSRDGFGLCRDQRQPAKQAGTQKMQSGRRGSNPRQPALKEERPLCPPAGLGSGDRLEAPERDVVAEGLQPLDQVPFEPIAVTALEVVGAEIRIGIAPGEHVVGNDQNGVAHSEGGLLLAETWHEAMILSPEVGLGFPRGTG
jgi:type I restriction enzyme M protein